jgi:photosystem II stability/assembly factor-like uncharacterized protein
MKHLVAPSFGFCLAGAFFFTLPLAQLQAGETVAIGPRLLDSLTLRCIGPATMGGRVVDLAVAEDKPAIMYVATASGGLWKTVNNGTTWKPIFDKQGTGSLGAVAVAPSDRNVVWAGTGEANPRNSVSWGDGVYKSTNGGRTWKNMGLRDSRHIGRIVIHPRNPNIVYIAALGHIWGPNEMRGLYQTLDGGRTWKNTFSINEDTGFVDVAMDPTDPNTLLAAAYQVRRDAYAGVNPAIMTGPGSGLYKTTDGGRSWRRLRAGLPQRPLGRCGLAVHPKDPRIVYAVIQTDKTDTSEIGQPSKHNTDASLGGIFRSADRGATWKKLNNLCPRPFYFGQIRLHPRDPQRVYVLGISLHLSTDGGKTFSRQNAAPGTHNDHHALWIDPRDPDHMVLGCDGGLNFSYDGGGTWEVLKNLPIGQFYGIGVDQRKPYRIYGGLQDNGCWGGPSATQNGEGILGTDWFKLIRGDGMSCQVDPGNSDRVYAGVQYGKLRRIKLSTGTRLQITPRAPRRAAQYRFNWTTPFLVSTHNARVLYAAGNHVFKSLNRGGKWAVISPDLTRGKPGPSKHTGHTITALAESPMKAGLLYAGTDDGRVHITRNQSRQWIDLTSRVPLRPQDGWISSIACSPFAEGTAYLAIDRHRLDDRAPYVWVTSDYGSTWKSLSANLPGTGPVRVIRADPRNPRLLYLGTEFGLYLSLDSGGRWLRVGHHFPTVAVHDLVVHARERELVIATHGRSLYILDIAPLQEFSRAVLAADVHFFDVKPATLFPYPSRRDPIGGKTFVGQNPPFGATLSYYLRLPLANPARITVTDLSGNKLRTLNGSKEAGLHCPTWDLSRIVWRGLNASHEKVASGQYLAVLEAGDQRCKQKITVEQ